MIATALAIIPGIEKHHEPPHTKAHVRHSPVEPWQTSQGGTGEVAPRHTGNQQLQARSRSQNNRGPQVRLLEDQQRHHTQDKHVWHVRMDKTVEAFLIQRQSTSHIQEQCVLGKLRGLYGQWPERQPTACASDLLAKNGHQHQDKGHERHQERWGCQAPLRAIGDGAHDPQTEQTKTRPRATGA